MADNGIQVSLFIDPEVPQVEAAARLGAPMIELHTGCFANHSGRERTEELARLKRAAELAHSLGIQVNAGPWHQLPESGTAAGWRPLSA